MLNELFLNRMKEYLQDEYDDFIQSYQYPNIRAFRINPLFLSEDDFENIFDGSITKMSNVCGGYYLNQEMKLGYHPLHHAGAFYMQDPSAMLPPLSFPIPENAFVLDMCAAPGGKSIELAERLTNGYLISNEIDYKRACALYSNIERMGLKNVAVTNNKPADFLKGFCDSFDCILVDAPCSGEGMFRKYPESQSLWSLENVEECAKRDKEILDVATKLLKKDGILIYSTCTFAREENENMISYLVQEKGFVLQDIDSKLQENLVEGFLPKTYRFYPHKAEGEGQFLAVLKKINGSLQTPRLQKKYVKNPLFDDFVKKNNVSFSKPMIENGNYLYAPATPYDLSSLHVLNYGVKLGELLPKRFVPDHQFFKAYANAFHNKLDLDFKDPTIEHYLHGEEINSLDVSSGFGVLFVNHVPLGGFKASNGSLKNYYPKGLRNF